MAHQKRLQAMVKSNKLDSEQDFDYNRGGPSLAVQDSGRRKRRITCDILVMKTARSFFFLALALQPLRAEFDLYGRETVPSLV
jgi:hypothetical protein